MMEQNSVVVHHVGRSNEQALPFRRPSDSTSVHGPWRSYEIRQAGLMVFDYKGRLMKADSCAQSFLAAVGIELSVDARLRIDALDTTDAKAKSDCELPAWLDPRWIEPIIEGNERLATVVQIPDAGRRRVPFADGGLPTYKLRRVVEFVEAQLDRPITLGRLAASVNLSPFHFHRQFKRSVGVTPKQFIHRLRIDRAKSLLSKSDLPLAQVAMKVGFADQSHFTAAFRRATSMTPGRYRNVSTA